MMRGGGGRGVMGVDGGGRLKHVKGTGGEYTSDGGGGVNGGVNGGGGAEGCD